MILAHPVTLPEVEVAQVPFIVDDAFYDDPDVCSLPDCSVAFLMLAGPWSARNSQSGFVPTAMLARFSSDPDLVTRTLHAAGFLRRAKGGWQIAEGRGVTVINAADSEARKAEAQAAAEAQRAGKAAGGRHGNHKRWHEQKGRRAPGCEFCEADTSPQAKRTSHPIAMRSLCDSDATPRSDDFDLDQSSGSVVSQSSVRNARASEDSEPADAHARDPDLLRTVAAEFGRKAGRIIGDTEAAQVITTLTGRAKEAGTVIRDPQKYFAAGVRNEADANRLLDGDPPPLREILAEPIPEDGPERHPYEDDPATGACAHPGCGLPRTNRRHDTARSA